jgi:hypothetical protein
MSLLAIPVVAKRVPKMLQLACRTRFPTLDLGSVKVLSRAFSQNVGPEVHVPQNTNASSKAPELSNHLRKSTTSVCVSAVPVNLPYTPSHIEEALSKIKGEVIHTPIVTSEYIDSLLPKTKIFFKAELLQKTGSFKFRGVLHALCCMSPADLVNGVVAHSSGNHGLALAYAAKTIGIKCYIVMVSPFKIVLTDSCPLLVPSNGLLFKLKALKSQSSRPHSIVMKSVTQLHEILAPNLFRLAIRKMSFSGKGP